MTEQVNRWLSTRRLALLLGAAAFLWFLTVAGLTVLRYKSNLSSTYDFGIFSQMFYYMDQTWQPLTTCERDGLLSHFAVHVSPVFYTLLPLYKIVPSPATLLVLQAFLVISGILPLCLICKRSGLSNLATLVWGLIYCTYPALAGGCFYDFHENKFLTVLILWTMYLIEIKRYHIMMIFSLLILFVKEDAPVYAACIGLYLAFGKKEYRWGAGLFLLSCAYFCFVIWYLNTYGNGAMVNRFDNFISDKELGLISIFKTLLVNPAYVLTQIAAKDKIIFFLQMALPLGLLPFLSRRWTQWILLIPFLLINLMSNYTYQHSIYFQYTYGSAAFLFYLSVTNYKELKAENKSILLPSALIGSVLIFYTALEPKMIYLETYAKQRDIIMEADRLLEEIPQDASVKSTTLFVPKLSAREEIYLISSEHETEYVVIDLRSGHEKYAAEMILDFSQAGYSTVDKIDGYLIIMKK